MPGDRLDGWKEISSFLRRNIRTCQRWEKEHDLPIYRINHKSTRAKVHTFKSEMNAWLLKAKSGRELPDGASFLNKTIPVASILTFLLLVVILGAVWIFLLNRNFTNPACWELRGQRIVFLDEGKQILWGVDVESTKDLSSYYQDCDDEYYLRPEKYIRDHVVISDTNGDGKKEVLLSLNHDTPSLKEVAFYNHRGKQLWSIRPELKQPYPENSFLFSYKPIDLKLEDIDDDGEKEALILWNHHERFPAIFMICDRKGSEMCRFEHTGRLQFITVIKQGGFDGHIFLGGTNNLLDGDAVLAVLDCSRLKSGTAPPYNIPSEYKDLDWKLSKYVPINPEPAGLQYYLRFKKNRISIIDGIQWQNTIGVNSDGGFCSVDINARRTSLEPLYFTFDEAFNLTDITPCADFKRSYAAMLKNGLVQQPIRIFLQSLKQDVLFWDGSGWTANPTDLLQIP